MNKNNGNGEVASTDRFEAWLSTSLGVKHIRAYKMGCISGSRGPTIVYIEFALAEKALLSAPDVSIILRDDDTGHIGLYPGQIVESEPSESGMVLYCRFEGKKDFGKRITAKGVQIPDNSYC